MQFSDLYGTVLDTELGTADRSVRFTLALRKQFVNEGQREFNALTSCFVRRAAVAVVDETPEYDLESTGIIAAGDYLWPSKTSASLKRVGTATAYTEGPDLPYMTEEELNQTRPNWRAESPGVPRCWYLREDGGASYVGLFPAPDIPSGETWTVLWPYVAQPPDLSADADEPFTVSSNAKTTLRPYHRALAHYAAAQLEKLRKDVAAVQRQMQAFTGYVARYTGDQQPRRGTQIRLAHDYRTRLRSARPLDPTRYP